MYFFAFQLDKVRKTILNFGFGNESLSRMCMPSVFLKAVKESPYFRSPSPGQCTDGRVDALSLFEFTLSQSSHFVRHVSLLGAQLCLWVHFVLVSVCVFVSELLYVKLQWRLWQLKLIQAIYPSFVCCLFFVRLQVCLTRIFFSSRWNMGLFEVQAYAVQKRGEPTPDRAEFHVKSGSGISALYWTDWRKAESCCLYNL